MVLINLSLFREREEQGFITCRPHPTGRLLIWNYTPRCQFERVWDDVTIQARGLITTPEGQIVARPFKKFFNLEEYQGNLPLEPFTVTTKMDGCFVRHTALNLWGGGTITIGEIVKKRLSVTLVGMDEHGALVPTQVIDWHQNGKKDYWLDIEVNCSVSRVSGAGGHPNCLRVTANHQIWVNGSYRPAIEIQPGDRIITQELAPSPEAIRLIQASLLGDGCLLTSATKPDVAKYQESHSEKQIEYAYWLRAKLGTCGIHRSDTVSGHGSRLVWAGSREYRALGTLRNQWYIDGVKRVPQDLSWLDDFAIAKWFMDDGSTIHTTKQLDRVHFATNSFSREDVDRLAGHLEMFYGVKCSVYNSKGWNIRINSGKNCEIDRFWRAIAPYIIPSMRYKLPDRYRDLPTIDIADGYEQTLPREVSILSVTSVEPTKRNFPAGRQGYDITTTTGNYFARGILVHNSLGILYFLDGMPQIATRGSFTSDQAVKANEILQRTYGEILERIHPEYTYLFEIIYPDNRIVVNYGDTEDLVLLAAIHTETGLEVDLHRPTTSQEFRDLFPLVTRYDGITDIAQLRAIQEENAEGFVIRFQSGLRLKLKFEEYVRLHRLMTHVNARVIWELLKTDQPLDEMLERVPDEFYAWVKRTRDDLTARFSLIEMQCREVVKQVQDLPTRKEQAAIVVKTSYPGIVFSMLDKKNYQEAIWKLLYPDAARPFKIDDDA